jgi:hypothetical protein
MDPLGCQIDEKSLLTAQAGDLLPNLLAANADLRKAVGL